MFGLLCKQGQCFVITHTVPRLVLHISPIFLPRIFRDADCIVPYTNLLLAHTAVGQTHTFSLFLSHTHAHRRRGFGEE